MNNYIYDTEYPKDHLKKAKDIFRLASVFNGFPVFKRNSPFAVFGQCPPDSVISSELFHSGKKICSETVRSVPSGNIKTYGSADIFRLTLPPIPQGKGYSLTVTCLHGDNISVKKVKNICFGEVFLAGGQSNMEFELQNCTEGPCALKNDAPDVRFYYTPKSSVFDHDFSISESKAGWKTFSARKAKSWSAVGYFFAKELSEKLGCTVGIIGCNWGGTSASAWMPYDVLSKDPKLGCYLTDYEKASGTKPLVRQKKIWDEYISYTETWQKKIDEFYKKNPSSSWEDALKYAGECRYPGPSNSFNPMRPSGLYETMLKRVAPYTLSGFIYYQGESDDHHPDLYEKLFTSLIYSWRKLWNDDTLPFLFVQLPMHRYIGDPDKKNWCGIRDAQTNVFKNVPHTGMAVALDCGAYNDIHPKKKKEVAHRLALLALNRIYGIISEDEATSPVFDSCYFEGEKLVLNFSHGDQGFIIKESIPDGDPNPPEKINTACFEISSDGKNWTVADPSIKGSKILLSSDNILNTKFVRYAFTNYGKVMIFASNMLPLTPFCYGI